MTQQSGAVFDVQGIVQMLALRAAGPQRIEGAMEGDVIAVLCDLEPSRDRSRSDAPSAERKSETYGPAIGRRQADGKVEADQKGSVCSGTVSQPR